jgi:hypothetical protein
VRRCAAVVHSARQPRSPRRVCRLSPPSSWH